MSIHQKEASHLVSALEIGQLFTKKDKYGKTYRVDRDLRKKISVTIFEILRCV